VINGNFGSLFSCCDGIRELLTGPDQCHCNPTIDVILNQGEIRSSPPALYLLAPVCRVLQPVAWWNVPSRPHRRRICNKRQQTYNYNCGERSDIEIDGLRLQSIMTFANSFIKYNTQDSSSCFDAPAFVDELREVYEEDAYFYGAYGLNFYRGIESIAEYVAIPFPAFSHDMWTILVTQDPEDTSQARLDVSSNGMTWHVGSAVNGSFLRGTYPYYDIYTEIHYTFRDCDTKIAFHNLTATDGLKRWVEMWSQVSQFSKRWGMHMICRYHTEYCAGNTITKQYESEQECLDYMKSLPLYSEKCGPKRPMAGHTLPCKWKHHNMIPVNPAAHCPHIGKEGVSDVNGDLKCDDIAECTDDEGQNQWISPMQYGDNTPADVLAIFEASNVGYENENLGCNIPLQR